MKDLSKLISGDSLEEYISDYNEEHEDKITKRDMQFVCEDSEGNSLYELKVITAMEHLRQLADEAFPEDVLKECNYEHPRTWSNRTILKWNKDDLSVTLNGNDDQDDEEVILHNKACEETKQNDLKFIKEVQ